MDYKNILKQFLMDMKEEIEEDGLIATLDEAIIRVDNAIKDEKK